MGGAPRWRWWTRSDCAPACFRPGADVARRSSRCSAWHLVPTAGASSCSARTRATSPSFVRDHRRSWRGQPIGDTTSIAGVDIVLAPGALQYQELHLRVDPTEDAIARFQSGLKVSRPARDADLIAIRTRAGDPIEAAAMANLLAANVIADRQAFRRTRTNSAVTFLQSQSDTLQQQLRAAENRLQAYRESAHVVDAPEQAHTQVDRLAELQSRLAVVRADRDAFAALIAQLRADTAGRDLGGQSPSRRLMAFPTLLQNQSASVLLGALAQVETQRADLLIRRTPQDSDVQVLTARIREIESQLQGIAESFQQSLSNQVASLGTEAGRFETQLDALPEKELQAARLERDAKVMNDLWVLVQTRLKEAEITGAVADPTVRVVDEAAAPLRSSWPKLPVNLALALVLGDYGRASRWRWRESMPTARCGRAATCSPHRG